MFVDDIEKRESLEYNSAIGVAIYFTKKKKENLSITEKKAYDTTAKKDTTKLKYSKKAYNNKQLTILRTN